MCCETYSDNKGLSLATNGWTPQFSIIELVNGYIISVVNWTGGTKNKPLSPLYIGSGGLVTNVDDATVIPMGGGEVATPVTSNNIIF